MSFKTLAMPVAGLLIAVAAVPATAQLAADRQTRIVGFQHSELMTEAGRARIEQRLSRAVDRVCRVVDGGFTRLGRVDRNCRVEAMADARRQLADRVASAIGTVQVAAIKGGGADR